ncbi:hypothetical protein BDN72DRAFT_775752 [Pluteus cervinus]|uniref:Uncharacterized protein n=1 Tax=Pluteus cervinus TaxID=181527 RepID=A0ACD3ADE6_9AGAR|nr:hypothetical protein BDN72DRAFT_775752 [Pluteus cervinus]
MPATVLPGPTHTAGKGSTSKPRAQAQTKKTRIIRRRGRANNAIESDDEIEREAATDSDTDDGLSPDSDSDSDTEPASEDVISHDHHAHIRIPSSSQSPGDSSTIEQEPVKHDDGANGAAPFFPATTNWSEMVADENANGPAELPVIEFTEFDGNAVPSLDKRSRKAKRGRHHASKSPGKSVEENDEGEGGRSESTSGRPTPHRQPGQTARQAYQQRLESDPSYVPTVGGFWGHDDRLLDKDLRSLSGWWRGRWQGRGRGFVGRGRGFVGRGRGRGGPFQSRLSQESQPEGSPQAEVAPIEKAWTHDAYEQMKKDDEHSPNQQGSRGFRGSPARGRGNFSRGGFYNSPTRARGASPHSQPGRVWFAMKPELMWTKQHEAFLYFDTYKVRHNQGPSYRVKLPGRPLEVIKALPNQHTSRPSWIKVPAVHTDDEEKHFVIRLPKPPRQVPIPESFTTSDEPPIEEVFKVRPQLAPRDPQPILLPVSTPISTIPSAQPHLDTPPPANAPSLPDADTRSQLEQLSLEPQKPDPVRWAQTEEAVLRNPPSAEDENILEAPVPERPVLPPLQTVFTPPPVAPSPGFGSPYGYPALPPGIALNQHGVPYELATGRPVYLPAPPPPMYHPRPVLHTHTPSGVRFVPGHMQHPSLDYMSQPPSHTPPTSGYQEPASFFSFPRQTSRIEIRAPDGKLVSSVKSTARRPSALVANTINGTQTENPEAPQDFPSLANPTDLSAYPNTEASGGGEQHHHRDPSMVSYPPYPPYYYPDAYGYAPYMDMSQAGHYEQYPTDPHMPQGAVYY